MDDLISRQAAIEELERMVKMHEHDRFGGELFHWTGVKAMLDLLPSAQPEIIRCKYCKHRHEAECPMYHEEDIEWDDDGYIERETIYHDWTKDDGYCDRAERRTDE